MDTIQFGFPFRTFDLFTGGEEEGVSIIVTTVMYTYVIWSMYCLSLPLLSLHLR